ncbi:serine/threonine protein kinase [Colletotrichum abscissum]|uniref:serine/threonine protein kinase n=1 Tax=Colletotrichum abscissum TaxID=1671311 RepID=UPI0027D56685|nr:serine/threonine protein kinase [Colletotrichum abscissum]KAK1483116.1 serine/threonine protein kinase [Colletotrichum abscissum]
MTPAMKLVRQEMNMKNLDMEIFVAYLDAQFGASNYHLQAKRGGYVLDSPRRLSGSELEDLQSSTAYSSFIEENGELERLQRVMGKGNNAGKRGKLLSMAETSGEDHDIRRSSFEHPLLPSEEESIKILDSVPSHQLSDDTDQPVVRKSLDHPNIVELLSVFKDESGGEQHFNFAFPLALGNLKRMFLGEYDAIAAVISQTPFLWPQMVGLVSAVTFLHETAHTAHRDIKPSNILIYQDNTSGSLVLKLTDFGLAINLTNALTWQEGSAAAMSALNYDAPEMRSAFTKSREGKFKDLPSPKQMLSNDIWKLGCVLTELAAFIVGGSSGVKRFRSAITTETGNILYDSFNDVRFDDGERVKPEVMDYLTMLKPRSREISQVEPILHAMLDDISVRPSSREVCQLLINKTGLVKYPYHDGARHVSLRPEEWTPGILDELRLKTQSFSQPVSARIPQRPSVVAKEVYWCMDEVFTEPKETLLRPVAVDPAITDETFYILTNRALDRARGGLMKGWFLSRLSWKRCVGVVFKQFHIVKTNRDQVILGKIELPPQAHLEYEHGMLNPEDVHMKIAAVQMVAGLMDPKTARGEKIMTNMLPKKKIPPNLQRAMGMCGWGIYAQMGFSPKRILLWLIFCMILMLTFAIVWLICINSTDLQNALVPATIVLTTFTIILGVAQTLG